MKVQKHIEVRLLKKRMTCPFIDLVQYNTGVQLVFSVVDFNIPSGTTATLYVQKRSGKFVYQEKNITVSGNTITIDLENQALTEHGETKYQIMLKNGSDTVTTFTGVLRIEKSLADANAVESKTVVRAFDEAVAEHVAEFQTKAEQIVQACIATIPDDYTTMEAKVNELANSIKGNLSGAVVFADDVSPVEHEPEVWVHGINLMDLASAFGEKCKNGERYYTVNDNVLTVIENDVRSWTDEDAQITLKQGTYTVKFDNSCRFSLGYDGAMKYDTYTETTYTFVLTETKNVMLKFLALANQNYPLEVGRVWIVKGSDSGDYEPYIDPSTVTVKRCGKNLLNLADVKNGNGATSNIENGKFTVTGYFASVTTSFLQGGERYTASFNSTRTGEVGGGLSVEFFDETGTRITGIYKQNELSAIVSFTVPENTVETRFYFYGSGTSTGTSSSTYTNVQVEHGYKATNYEIYKGEEYIPSSDGTVSGMTSVSPNMTILTDTEGAIVECEYNRDTNKVIEKLTNAIKALGGTV